jgi:hypothetical protein
MVFARMGRREEEEEACGLWRVACVDVLRFVER